MDLGTPQSAIVSAIIFNAIVIPLLIPLSLRGVRYRPIGATALLRRNLWIYGLGGIVAPFIGIKLIDLIVHNLLGGLTDPTYYAVRRPLGRAAVQWTSFSRESARTHVADSSDRRRQCPRWLTTADI